MFDKTKRFLLMRQWGWKSSGVMLGLTFIIAIALIKPIGVSTQYVVFDAIVWNAVQPELIIESDDAKSGYSSTNTYLNKSGGKYAKTAANPLSYGLVFVIFMVIGGFFGRNLERRPIWQSKQSQASKNNLKNAKQPNRYTMAFIGGVLVLIGARLAGGCTSGHMMSGMMQTSLSGYLFVIGAFGAGIPMALLLYGRQTSDK